MTEFLYSEVEMRKSEKIKLVDVAIVAASILAATGFWTRNILLIALIIPAGIVLVTSKAATKEEKDRRESLSLKSFAFSLFIPIIIIFAMVIYFIGRLVPLIIDSWQ